MSARAVQRRILTTFAVGLLSLATFASKADLLVSTGPGFNEYGGANIFGSSGSNSNYAAGQSIAGEIALTGPVIINSVEGWLATETAGTVTAVLYGNDNNLPGSQLFAATFTISPAAPPEPGALPGATWYGPSGLSWDVSSGTYWLAFEVRPSDSLYGIYPITNGALAGVTMQDNSPNPLALYSYGLNGPGTYTSSFPDPNRTVGWGMQVIGQPVPLPASTWLLLSGLGGLVLLRKRRDRAPAVQP